MRTHEVPVRGGASLHVRDCGTGTPLLFIHGWGVDGSLFEHQIAGLSETHRVIVPDLRGHGKSGSGDTGFLNLRQLADDMAALIDHLSLENVTATGWSMGAMVLWDLLARRKAGISRLVTIDMSPMIVNDREWQLGLRDGRDLATALQTADAALASWPAMAGNFVPRIFAPSDRASLVSRTLATALSNDPVPLAALWESMARADYRPVLPQISVPTLAIYGRQSQLYRPETSFWVADCIPDATVSGFWASGHAPHLEEPANFNQTIMEFSARDGENIWTRRKQVL